MIQTIWTSKKKKQKEKKAGLKRLLKELEISGDTLSDGRLASYFRSYFLAVHNAINMSGIQVKDCHYVVNVSRLTASLRQ